MSRIATEAHPDGPRSEERRPIWLWENITKLNAALALIVTLVSILATGVTVARHYFLLKSTVQRSNLMTPYVHHWLERLEIILRLTPEHTSAVSPQSYEVVSPQSVM